MKRAVDRVVDVLARYGHNARIDGNHNRYIAERSVERNPSEQASTPRRLTVSQYIGALPFSSEYASRAYYAGLPYPSPEASAYMAERERRRDAVEGAVRTVVTLGLGLAMDQIDVAYGQRRQAQPDTPPNPGA